MKQNDQIFDQYKLFFYSHKQN